MATGSLEARYSIMSLKSVSAKHVPDRTCNSFVGSKGTGLVPSTD